ncbi:MAG: putative bifunctional diguanylate cyclase/phosphodiesterase [Gammaproteobacteria bacterium]
MARILTSAGERVDWSTFLGTLEEVIAAAAEASERVGLLLVHLMHLDRLNASLGYRDTDAALLQLASRLAEGLGTRAQVVRIGTGKFAVVLRGLEDSGFAVLAARKVERLIRQPMDASDRAMSLGVAQGAALYPVHSASAGGLLQKAEIALRSAKSTGKAFAVYDAAEADGENELMRAEAVLAHALEDGGIECWFQPQIDLRDGTVWGAEALMRYRDANGAHARPELLLQAAERARRLPELTSIMLDAALRHASEWSGRLARSRVAVNIGAENLRDPELVASVAAALTIWNARADDLTIEITETALMIEPEKSRNAMEKLRDLGVRVAIDDFGTGYSSLSYFKHIPASELKVDQSFIVNMHDDTADRKIVQTVIHLAHAFELKVVAEGIQDERALRLLGEMNCDIGQGFWFGKPMPADAFLDWLSSARSTSRRPA